MLFNTIFLVYGVVIDRQEIKRTKTIQAAKLKYEEVVKAINEKKRLAEIA